MFQVIAIVVILLLVVFFYFKQKNEEWVGEVIDKKQTASYDEDGVKTIKSNVVIKLSNGKKKNLSMNLNNGFVIGDKVEKKKGDYYPKKITS